MLRDSLGMDMECHTHGFVTHGVPVRRCRRVVVSVPSGGMPVYSYRIEGMAFAERERLFSHFHSYFHRFDPWRQCIYYSIFGHRFKSEGKCQRGTNIS